MGRLSNPRDEPRTRPFLIKNLPPDAGFSHFSTKWASITLTEQFAGILKESRALPRSARFGSACPCRPGARSHRASAARDTRASAARRAQLPCPPALRKIGPNVQRQSSNSGQQGSGAHAV